MSLIELVEDLTIEKAVALYEEKGICCIFADGKLKQLSYGKK